MSDWPMTFSAIRRSSSTWMTIGTTPPMDLPFNGNFILILQPLGTSIARNRSDWGRSSHCSTSACRTHFQTLQFFTVSGKSLWHSFWMFIFETFRASSRFSCQSSTSLANMFLGLCEFNLRNSVALWTCFCSSRYFLTTRSLLSTKISLLPPVGFWFHTPSSFPAFFFRFEGPWFFLLLW